MIISVPAKLILFGEWAVLDGHPAIATAVEKSLVVTTSDLEHKTICYSSPEEEDFCVPDLNSPVEGFYSWAHRCLENLSLRFREFQNNPHYKFYFDRRWDLSEGLGSSSAIFLALNVWAQKKFLKSTYSTEDLLPLRQQLKVLQRGRGSGLDLSVQFTGGSIVFSGGTIEPLKLKKPEELVVVHTGKKMNTMKALQDIHPEPHWNLKLGQSVENFLIKGDFEKTIEEHYLLLNSLGVVPHWLKDFRVDLKNKGLVTTLKTCGAGGGDSLLLWSPVEKHEKLLAYLRNYGFWRNDTPWNAPGFQLKDSV